MDAKYLTLNKRTPCPACGGTDRYTFVDKNPNQTCFCSKCDIGGDGFNMLSKYLNISFYSALSMVAEILEGADITPIKAPEPQTTIQTKTISKPKLKAFYSMLNSTTENPSTTAINYYKARGLGDFTGKVIDSLSYGDISYSDKERGTLKDREGAYIQSSAIVALLSRYDSKPTGAMQIYLDDNQISPHVEKFQRKKFMNISPDGLIGAGVWLTKAKTRVLHVAEGLENLLSVCYALNTRAGVACGTRALLAGLIIPDFIYELHIWSDSDEKGIYDAAKLKARYENRIDVVLHVPERNKDWNDVLIESGIDDIKREFYIAL
jgi:putative DNA primase/helicase